MAIGLLAGLAVVLLRQGVVLFTAVRQPSLLAYPLLLMLWAAALLLHGALRGSAPRQVLDGDVQATRQEDVVDRHPWRSLLFFCAASLLIYLPAAFYLDFLSDDFCYAHSIPCLGIRRYLESAWTPGQRGPFFRPLVHMSFLLDYLLFGLTPQAFHIHNLLVNGLRAFLTAKVAARLFTPERSPWLSIAVGVLCLAYPTNHEAITWVACRFDGYAGLFTTLAVYWFLCADFSWRRAGLTTAAAICALLSKETAIMLPLLLLMILVVRPGRGFSGGWVPRLSAIVFNGAAVAAVFIYCRLAAPSAGLAGIGNRLAGAASDGRAGLLRWYVYLTGDNPLARALLPVNHFQIPPEVSVPLIVGLLTLLTIGCLRGGQTVLGGRSLIVLLGWALLFFAPAARFPLYNDLEGSRYFYCGLPAQAMLTVGLIARVKLRRDASRGAPAARLADWIVAPVLGVYVLLNGLAMIPYCEASAFIRVFRTQMAGFVPYFPPPKVAPAVIGPRMLDDIKGVMTLRQDGYLMFELSGRTDLTKLRMVYHPNTLAQQVPGAGALRPLVWDDTTRVLSFAEVAKASNGFAIQATMRAPNFPEPETDPLDAVVQQDPITDLASEGIFHAWYGDQQFLHMADAAGHVWRRVRDTGGQGARVMLINMPVLPSGTPCRLRLLLRAPEQCFERVVVTAKEDFARPAPFLGQRVYTLGGGWAECVLPFTVGDSGQVRILIASAGTTLPALDIAEATVKPGLYGHSIAVWPQDGSGFPIKRRVCHDPLYGMPR